MQLPYLPHGTEIEGCLSMHVTNSVLIKITTDLHAAGQYLLQVSGFHKSVYIQKLLSMPSMM